MSIFEKIYNVLNYEIQTPVNYGAFHIVSLILIAAATFILCKLFLGCDEKTERKIALYFWITVISLELYKQYNYTLSYEDGKAVWDYAWYIFPFQFCSSPFYVLPFIAFSKNERLREAAAAFMGTFSLFAGIAVCLYPTDIYIETLGIDIQTTVHHGSQVVLGFFFALRRFTAENTPKIKKYFLSATAIFSSLVLLAIILDFSFYHILQANGIDETFNMFFISPYFDCSLPLLSSIQYLVPYPVVLLVYVFGFSAAAAIAMGVTVLISKAVKKASSASADKA